MKPTEFTFTVQHEGISPGDLIMSLLSGQPPKAPDNCSCNECTAERMIKDPSERRPTAEQLTRLAKDSLLTLLKSAQHASDRCGEVSALIIERPTGTTFDDAILLHRVEVYNATARVCQSVAALIPEPAMTAELREMLPTPVSWETALAMLEKQRAEVLEIVRARKSKTSVHDVGVEAARIVGSEIAKVVKEATRNGDNPRTEDEIKAIIEAAAERAKSAIRNAAERTPTYPPPPPADQVAP